MITLVEVLQRTTTFFEGKGIPSARLDAQLLLGHVLQLDRVKLYLNFDRLVTEPELETLRGLVRRRGEREPLAWVLGEKEFYGRDFIVGPGVLVPRPDTETLVEVLLAELAGGRKAGGSQGVIAEGAERPVVTKKLLPWSASAISEPLAPVELAGDEADRAGGVPSVESGEAGAGGEAGQVTAGQPTAGASAQAAPRSDSGPVFVADVGSGSGCIGITLALECPQVRVYAIDASSEALDYTRRNVEKHGLKDRVAVLSGRDLAVPAARMIDWVVSNPPYIPAGELPGLAPEVSRHEPRLALDGGSDGLDMYRRLIPVAAARARIGIAFEVGAGQAEQVAEMLGTAGFSAEVRNDYGGVGRVVVGRRGAVGAERGGGRRDR